MEISNYIGKDNFYAIKKDSILFWGLDIKKPILIKLKNDLKNFIENNNLHINEVCELNEKEDIELLVLCYEKKDKR